MKNAARTLNGVVLALIQERRREGRDHGDLLSMLIQARDEETGEAMTEDDLCSEALTFLVAGHETTSTALTWTWFLLGSHPSIRQRVREEVGRILGDRLPTIEDVPHLTTTRMAIEESMRLCRSPTPIYLGRKSRRSSRWPFIFIICGEAEP